MLGGWSVRGWFTEGELGFSPTGVPGATILLVGIEVEIGATLLVEIGAEIDGFCGATWFTFW